MYSFSVKVQGSFEEVEQRLVAALKQEGFGVMTEIDVKKTLKAKLDLDFRPYRILGACNPQLAFQALSSDLDVGLLLPCNIVVRQDDDGVSIGFLDPIALFSLANAQGLGQVATEAKARLERVAAALAA